MLRLVSLPIKKQRIGKLARKEEDMYFRKAESKDAEILQMFMEELVDAPGNRELLKKKLQRIENLENYYLCLAYEGEEILGTAMGILCEDICEDCRNFLVIENVFVKKEHRGLGVAAKIFQELEIWGKKNNAYYSILVSEDRRERAHAFYEKAGYKKMGGFKKML